MKRLLAYLLAGAALLTASCIDNDLPYPTVEVAINGVEGEGFAVSNIDLTTRTVTLALEEATDIRNVRIDKVTYTVTPHNTNIDRQIFLDNSRPSQEPTGTFDMRTPVYLTLTLYQDYEWQIVATQTITRSFRVEGQVGATEFDGALVGSLGVYFQWGRKDPFIGANRIQKNYTDEYEGVGFQTTGDNGFTALFLYNDALCEGFKFVNKEMDMSMSIANPTVFYGVYNSGGWKGSNSEVEDYWGGASGTKTNNDPCPAGYRVPTFDEINGFIKDIDTNKTAQENVSDQSYGRKYTVGDQTFMFPGSALRVWSAKMRYPGRVTFFWSSTISPTTEKKALDFYDYRWNTNADNTCCAMAVRCIKIQ